MTSNAVKLQTLAECKAEKAESFSCFSGLKLLHIRRSITEILNLIGRGDIFDQYTKHDISHIDSMLELCEWLIPSRTQEAMTASDWLMLVLSIYFHDMGMLVTHIEYQERNTDPEFQAFVDGIENGSWGIDFREKVNQLGEEREKFMYQEYVRTKHAKRISSWIKGETILDGNCGSIVSTIKELLKPLHSKFRVDLAMVCESHHLDDLDDFSKYKTNVKYGSSNNETVNLHYVAIILRTADLLHITRDRTPSVLYHIIEPTDPKSIIEWRKQQAVSSVNSKEAFDEQGCKNRDLPRDTVEVTAYFEKADMAEAYFGLMSYIRYAKQEIQNCYKVVKESIRTQDTRSYEYPWRDIDDSNITAEGFETKQFQFTLDQGNILKLLVGHTLYNDSSIVIRELVQNSIDAIKLARHLHDINSGSVIEGKVIIEWDDEKRQLSVADNGTGMSLNDIESYLLKVGVSKYRSDEFIKKYPEFRSISRFGIGILTCFMIANDIDIITKTESDSICRCISIRGAHGKYLLRNIQPSSPVYISSHGTRITLNVRGDADMTLLLENIRKWIVFPSCRVTYKSATTGEVPIGYDTPRDALQSFLKDGIDGEDSMVVCDENTDGLDISFLARYNKYYNENTFASLEDDDCVRGLCIDGIRVDFSTPGFYGKGITAIANVTGHYKAQTNVARSAFEQNADYDILIRAIYDQYVSFINKEMSRIAEHTSSDAKASFESKYILFFLLNPSYNVNDDILKPINTSMLDASLGSIKCITIEENNERRFISADEAQQKHSFFILDSRIVQGYEMLLREADINTGFQFFKTNLYSELVSEPNAAILGNYDRFNRLHKLALKGKSVVNIAIDRRKRLVRLKYEKSEERWDMVEIDSHMSFRRHYQDMARIFIPVNDVPFDGLLENEIGVLACGSIYLKYGTDLTRYLQLKRNDFNIIENEALRESVYTLLCNIIILSTYIDTSSINADAKHISRIVDEAMQQRIRRYDNVELFPLDIWKYVDKTEFLSLFTCRNFQIYSPLAWSRSIDN